MAAFSGRSLAFKILFFNASSIRIVRKHEEIKALFEASYKFLIFLDNVGYLLMPNSMRQENIILQSFLKGIGISCVLIFFQIVFSASAPRDNLAKVTKYDNNHNVPVDAKEEITISIKSSSLHSTGCIEICRETLYLFEILFNVRVNLNQELVSVPLPLLTYLRTLFTAVISVNAP